MIQRIVTRNIVTYSIRHKDRNMGELRAKGMNEKESGKSGSREGREGS